MGLNWRQGRDVLQLRRRQRSMHGGDGFQGGSTFKVFVAAAALERASARAPPTRSGRSRNYKGEIFTSCNGSVKVTKRWVVDGPEVGNYNLWNGTSQSVNDYFVPLEQAVGLCPVTKMAKAVGPAARPAARTSPRSSTTSPSFTLGSVEITPLSMVTAYGDLRQPRACAATRSIIKSIKTKEGDRARQPEAGCKKVIDQGVADAVNKIFQGPFTSGTADRRRGSTARRSPARPARCPATRPPGRWATPPTWSPPP